MAPVVRVLSTSLVAVPAFIRVEPVTTSGPVRHGDTDVAGVAEQGRRLGAGYQHGPGAEGLGPAEGGTDVRGAPLAAMPTTASRADTRLASIACDPGVDVVLRPFGRADQRAVVLRR